MLRYSLINKKIIEIENTISLMLGSVNITELKIEKDLPWIN